MKLSFCGFAFRILVLVFLCKFFVFNGLSLAARFYSYDYNNTYSYEKFMDYSKGVATLMEGEMFVIVSGEVRFTDLKESRLDLSRLQPGNEALFTPVVSSPNLAQLPSFLSVRMTREVSDVERKEDKKVDVGSISSCSTYEVYFNLNSSVLTEDQKRGLERFVNGVLSKCGGNCTVELDIYGYACVLGGSSYNKLLSERRSREVESFIKQRFPKVFIRSVEGRGEVKDSGVLCLNRKVLVNAFCKCSLKLN